MKKKILERYRQTAEGHINIDISAGRIEDLYNNFDRLSPYVKKELDPELVEYLIDSVSEIGRREFIITFHLTAGSDDYLLSRVRTSIRNYFLYLKELEKKALAQMIRRSLIYLSIGCVIFSVTLWINQQFDGPKGVFISILSEGLTVASWVSFWQALANFIINWSPHRGKIVLYQRIACAAVEFKMQNK